jgi:hypothetical protein
LINITRKGKKNRDLKLERKSGGEKEKRRRTRIKRNKLLR